ncbi:hypothetical protein ACRAWD_04210 [Caulobacter segnis]
MLAGVCVPAIAGACSTASRAPKPCSSQAGRPSWPIRLPARVETAKTLVPGERQKVARIVDGYGVSPSPAARSWTSKDSFVPPGLIDSHVHPTGQQGPTSRLDNVSPVAGGRGHGRGRATPARPRWPASPPWPTWAPTNQAIFALRDGIKRGDVPGPRIIAAGSGRVGPSAAATATSTATARRSVRRCRADPRCARAPTTAAARCASRSGWAPTSSRSPLTGGVLSNTAAGLAQQFSDAELAAIVETAHRMGRKSHRPRPRCRRHQQLPEGRRRLDRARHLSRRR